MILHGDSLHILKTLDDNSVDSIVTDPPYGLSFMGKKWDYDVPTTELWREALRVLKPGGHLLSFFGTRTYHRGVVRVEDAGFEIRDQIMWIYGSGFPKSHNIKEGDFKGWGTALKPANEPIVLARKPLSESTVAQNVLKWGTGAINVDESRISTSEKLQSSTIRNDIRGGNFKNGKQNPELGITYNQHPQCRWPANVLFDESAAEMLDAQSGMLKSGASKSTYIQKESENSCMSGKNYERKMQDRAASSGGASRFFYVAKASKSERNKGLEGMPELAAFSDGANRSIARGETFYDTETGGGMNRIKSTKNHHPTVKPIKLMQYLIKLVTPPNGTVLDPFAGSGSTLVAAKSLNFKFIGIELNEEYVEIAKKRVGHCLQTNLKIPAGA